MNSWLSLVPPVIAIALAIKTRQVIFSLFVGVFTGAFILSEFNLFNAFVRNIEIGVNVILDPGNARMLLFSLLIGAIVFLVQRSGGVNGFVAFLANNKVVDTPRKAALMTSGLGTALFLEGSMSILTVGTVAKPLFKRFRMSKEKLAYLADATCAPVAVLIPLNGWGAYLLLQMEQGGIETPVSLLIQSIPFFIYPIVAYLLALVVVLKPWDVGPLAQFEKREQANDALEFETIAMDRTSSRKAIYFIFPMLTLLISLFAFMMITGGGDLIAGDGSKSILYAVILSLVITYILYRSTGTLKTGEFMRTCLDGMKHLLEVVVILAMAFTINAVCKELQTGLYVSQLLAENLPYFLLPALIFIISALTAFSTGTSWGTFAIMLSIGLPIASNLELYMPLIVGAIVSGGVWGDHCSPISDTTVLSSLASDCDLMDHFQTQIPYALIGGALSTFIFLVLGILN